MPHVFVNDKNVPWLKKKRLKNTGADGVDVGVDGVDGVDCGDGVGGLPSVRLRSADLCPIMLCSLWDLHPHHHWCLGAAGPDGRTPKRT